MSAFRFTPLALVALTGLAALSKPASAEPMITDLPSVRANSTTIVVGTVDSVGQGTATISVDSALRGPKPAVPLNVGALSLGHADLLHERIVAFVDAKNEFRWYGKKIGGPDLEHGVLLLAGFYDFNAHLVTPGFMSFGQLKDYIATGVFPNRTLIGTLGFPDGHGGITPSTKHFVINLAPNGTTTATGFSIACQSFSGVSGLDWGSVDIGFNDTCLKSGRARSLRLSGVATGVDAMGNIKVMVCPASPILTEPEYETFVADGAIVDVTRVVRMTGTDGSRWSWRVDESLSDGTNVRAITTNHGASIAPPGPRGVVREDTWSYGDVTLKLTQTGPGSGQASLGNTRDVVAAVDKGIGVWTIEKKGAAPVRVTVAQDPPVFVRR